MKKCILHGVALAAFASLVLTVQAQEQIDQSQFPTILQQPVDACPLVGSSVTFSLTATNADSYQWFRNNTAVDGETNSSLTISSVNTNDVGYYSATAIKGGESVPTRSATLNVYMQISSGVSRLNHTASANSFGGGMSAMDLGGGGMIVVFGLPVVGGGGNGSGCPGRYSGFVNFTKTMSDGWGWVPTTNMVHTASDGNRSDTKVQYVGGYGDGGCGLTTVTVGTTYSPAYRFTIYFPIGVAIPTNSYPITLSGFNL